jgi:hypothetical protein
VQCRAVGRRERVQYYYQWCYSEVKSELRTFSRPEVVTDDEILISPNIKSIFEEGCVLDYKKCVHNISCKTSVEKRTQPEENTDIRISGSE